MNVQGKKLALLTSFIVFFFPLALETKGMIQTIDEADILGLWQTTVEEDGNALIIIFDIKETDTDSLICSVHWPEMGMSDIPYGRFLMKNDSILLPGLKARFHNNTITGVLSALGPVLDIQLKKIKEKPTFSITCPEREPDWIFETKAAVWAHPVISRDQLYFGNDDGNFYSIDLKTKSVNWTFQCSGSIKSKALVIDDKVSFASDDGYLFTLDSGTGQLIWKLDIGNAVSPRIAPAQDAYDYDFLCSSPVFDGNNIYIGSKDSCLYAIDFQKGEIAWKYKTGGSIRSTPEVDGAMVYVGSWDHFMYAINKQDGNLVWKYDAGWFIQSSPLIVKDKVVFGSRAAKVFALNKISGEEVWKTTFWGSWVESSPVFYDNKIYIGSSDFRKVFALEPATGQVLMSTLTSGWAWATPAISEDYIFTGTVGSLYYMEAMHGRFYAFERNTGKPVWQIKVDDNPDVFAYGFASSPTLWNDRVFVGGLDGKMYSLKVK